MVGYPVAPGGGADHSTVGGPVVRRVICARSKAINETPRPVPSASASWPSAVSVCATSPGTPAAVVAYAPEPSGPVPSVA